MKVLIYDDSGNYNITAISDLVSDVDGTVINMKGEVVDLPEFFIDEFRHVEQKYWDMVKQLERVYEATRNDLPLNQPK